MEKDNKNKSGEFYSVLDNLKQSLFNFKYGVPEFIKIAHFPDDWEPLGIIETDKIKRIDLGNINGSSCIYKVEKGGIFNSQTHPMNESLTVLEGSVEIFTPYNSRVLKKGESAFIKKGLAHKVYFKDNTSLFLFFEPIDGGNDWEADSLNYDVELLNERNTQDKVKRKKFFNFLRNLFNFKK